MIKRRLKWLSITVTLVLVVLLGVGLATGANLHISSEGLLSLKTSVILAAGGEPTPENELILARTKNSKTYQTGVNSFVCEASIGAIHYQDEVGDWQEIDCTPQKVDNAQLDGWIITQNGWHYALGQPGDKLTDGWVGFGGKHGEHWLKFKLVKAGYLHWDTRTWQDIGGNPTYNRINLVNEVSSIDMGGMDIHPVGIATWNNIWQTPGGGSLGVRWTANGFGLKEEVVVNQVARDWIKQNRPPTTPTSETYFGFVFQVDWSDIPKCIRDGIELDPSTDDFSDDGYNIELRNTLGELLGFMPVSEVYVVDVDGKQLDSTVLRKRFWKDADGNTYVLVGVLCSELNNLSDGDLIFDPTIDETVGSGANDGQRFTGSSGFSASAGFCYVGYMNNAAYYNCHIFQRWTGITMSGTVDVMYIQIQGANDTTGSATLKVYGVDEDNPAAPTSAAEFDADTLTTASVDWDGTWTDGVWEQSPSLVSIGQEWVDTYTISNDAIMLQVKNDGGTGWNANSHRHYDAGSQYAAKLHIEYTTEADISNSPSSKSFGTVANSTTYWSNDSEPSWPLTDGDAYFTVTNNGDQCSITIVATNFTGGVGWTLGAPAENVARLTAFKEGDGSGDGVILTTSPQAFISGLTTNIDWEIKFETPTSVTDGEPKTAAITLAATLD